MIDIKTAIEKSKMMPNISDGGSACYDFGDVVLVKYDLPLKYVRENQRARQMQESVMEGVNKKVEMGVNTPRHLAIERVIEGNCDVCYVLQEKCPGVNCNSKAQYGAPYEKVIKELEEVYNIPFEHYVKLVSDGCNLLEMGYESKNKNLFYDKDSGFWFIDFLENDKNKEFDQNNPVKIFEAVKHTIPKPRQIASWMAYDAVLSSTQQEKYDLLENLIETKFFLAIKQVIPNFEKYEKFFLISKNNKFKHYLMENNIINKNLFMMEENDYQVYNELYDIVTNIIIDMIVNKDLQFWSVETNEIRIFSEFIGLIDMWQLHKDNLVNKEDFEDVYDYECASEHEFIDRMLDVIASKLELIESNDNVNKFFEDMNLNK